MHTRPCILSLFIVSLLLFPLVAFSQTEEIDLEEVELTRQLIEEKRKQLIDEVIDLSTEEERRFWPLYDRYRAEYKKAGDIRRDLLMSYLERRDEITDADAERLLAEAIRGQDDRDKILRKYLKEFRKIIQGKRLLNFFHLEAKMDTIIDYELSMSIPLTYSDN
jgi:hypothetical protein